MPTFISDSNITNELNNAGMAFGDLVQGVGNAVAETTRRLTETGAETTSTLATTLVDVIAAQETIYTDDGAIQENKIYTSKLPLINFVDPVMYEWSRVRLQGIFYAREFAAGSKRNEYTHSSSDTSSQGGLLLVLGGGATTFDAQGQVTDATQTATTDVSVGFIRMNAQLNPKTDIGVPKPRQSVQGPSLAVLQGAITDIAAAGANPPARTMSLLIEFRRLDGTPIPNKAISIETNGVAWDFTTPAQTTTDAAGQLGITLRREFPGEAPDLSPREFVITARKGVVYSDSTVNF